MHYCYCSILGKDFTICHRGHPDVLRDRNLPGNLAMLTPLNSSSRSHDHHVPFIHLLLPFLVSLLYFSVVQQCLGCFIPRYLSPSVLGTRAFGCFTSWTTSAPSVIPIVIKGRHFLPPHLDHSWLVFLGVFLGDKVIPHFIAQCRECRFCKSPRTNQCEKAWWDLIC